jgi:hypothetical protein
MRARALALVLFLPGRSGREGLCKTKKQQEMKKKKDCLTSALVLICNLTRNEGKEELAFAVYYLTRERLSYDIVNAVRQVLQLAGLLTRVMGRLSY